MSLKVSGTKIVDEEGKEIILRGAGLGGWMNMENFISGYPGCEFQIRHALGEAIGQEKSDFFFDKFLEYYFMEPDAKFFSSLGLNCIRLPFNYRHFEDDMNPRVLKESGFKHLDRVIDLCAAHGIHAIFDMHTAPAGQNTDWHADHGGHIVNFWVHKDFQDRTHYKFNKWIAGYNPLNEPTDPTHTRVIEFYSRVHSAIRAIDPEHIFFDGNTFASDFSHFDDTHKNWDNTAYSIHDYSTFGFPATPEQYKREWMDQRGLCAWNGYEGEAAEEINKVRYQVLKDQLQIYNKLYKDIGFQGIVYLNLETPHMTLFKTFLAKKHRLAVDAWGADDTAVKTIYQPLLDQFLYPAPIWRLSDRVTRLARNILVSEFLVKEWVDHFIYLWLATSCASSAGPAVLWHIPGPIPSV
ncbi:glycoside hydrolase superfamily [Mycena galopus ATCC 62051]|nr:glycoside hydrolase superfamily [Mycena galopus ATCC 62051]